MSRVSEVGSQIAALRKARGLTIVGLSELSSVSKAAISLLENGNGNPTIETLWSLADALGVEFSALLNGRPGVSIQGADGASVHLIKRTRSPQVVEAFQFDFPPGTTRHAQAHPRGVWEHVMVLSGTLLIGPKDALVLLGTGQSHRFRGDTPHVYQAGSESCSALVTVVYPLEEPPSTSCDQELTWPTTEDEWDSIRDRIARARTEIRNGCSLSRLTFPAASSACASSGSLAEAAFGLGLPGDPARAFVSSYGCPSLTLLYRVAETRAIAPGSTLQGALADRCRDLARLACPRSSQRGRFDRNAIAATSQSAKTMIEATLAAEALTRHGHPTVPAKLGAHVSRRDRVTGGAEPGSRLFEDRIDVDAYEAFELVHPAYARQVLALAEILPDLPYGDGDNLLDVGTGPGLPLQMLLELRPDIRVAAVDPSPVAHGHLTARFGTDRRVRPHQASITAFRPAVPFQAAISIGASHHLDTSTFLAACQSCLEPGGTLIVADEMLPPFHDAASRAVALVTHHLWYILDTLVTLPERSNPVEIALATMLADRLPLAMAMAQSGRGGAAVRLVQATCQEALSLSLPDIPSDDLAVFSRFHLLELQALVAGLDYEVEQKTHPARFRSLAERAGFDCVRHQRIYATAGDGDLDGGTHLFVLRRA